MQFPKLSQIPHYVLVYENSAYNLQGEGPVVSQHGQPSMLFEKLQMRQLINRDKVAKFGAK